MKVAHTVLSYFLISEISAYAITRFKGINDELVAYVGFDSEGNTYAIATSTGDSPYKLYKVNASNEVSSVTNIPQFTSQMLVSSKGDIYLHLLPGGVKRTVGVVRSGSRHVDTIDDLSLAAELFHLDNNDNLFYYKLKTVYVVRCNSSVSVGVPITNLKNVVISDQGAVSDKSGNTYLVVKNDDDGDSLALITQEALKQEEPVATFVSAFDHSLQYVTDLMVDEENDLWMAVYDKRSKAFRVTKVEKGNWKSILTDEGPLDEFVRSKERTYVIGEASDYKTKRILYITLKDEIVEIPELRANHLSNINGVADSDGVAYFYNTLDYSESPPWVVKIKPNETKPVPVTFATLGTSKTIKSAKLDFSDDLWIVMTSKDVYHLKKGEMVPKLLGNVNETCKTSDLDIHVNFAGKKIYLSCAHGLFVVENI